MSLQILRSSYPAKSIAHVWACLSSTLWSPWVHLPFFLRNTQEPRTAIQPVHARFGLRPCTLTLLHCFVDRKDVGDPDQERFGGSRRKNWMLCFHWEYRNILPTSTPATAGQYHVSVQIRHAVPTCVRVHPLHLGNLRCPLVETLKAYRGMPSLSSS